MIEPLSQIDGNPFAFTFGTGETSVLRKIDRKNWKKLKKNDIQHTFNSQLAGSGGATVVEIKSDATLTTWASTGASSQFTSRKETLNRSLAPGPAQPSIPGTTSDIKLLAQGRDSRDRGKRTS